MKKQIERQRVAGARRVGGGFGKRSLPLAAILLGIGGAAAFGQASTALNLPQTDYLTPTALPHHARAYLNAIGNRLRVAGNERLTMSGRVTDQNGTGAAVFIWEIPGNVTLTRQIPGDQPLTYLANPGAGKLATAPSLAQADLDILETLAHDSHEGFLYAVTQAGGHRLLGTGFRTGNGTLANYKGPFYDICESVSPVPVANNTVRQKWYIFDSVTGLLVKTRYILKRNGVDVATESQFSNWVSQNGQMSPGSIVRTENGKAVFTFTASQTASGPAVNDGLFSTH